jgi:hypothetical protein
MAVPHCTCPACGGEGTLVQAGTCWRCHGIGVLTGAQAANAMEDVCPACGGSGVRSTMGPRGEWTCDACRGSGALTPGQRRDLAEDAAARRRMANDLGQHVADAERQRPEKKPPRPKPVSPRRLRSERLTQACAGLRAQGLTYAEIARQLGLSAPHSAWRWCNRARIHARKSQQKTV